MELQALIESRPAVRGELGEWYAAVLEAAARERVRVADLAERLGCSSETIYSWRRRLASGDPAATESSPAGLVRVELAPSSAPVGHRIEIRISETRSILVPDTFDPAALTAIVEVLERC